MRTRRRLLVALLASWILLPALVRAQDAKASPTVRLVFVGDVMLDRTPGRAMAAGADPFASFADVLTGADITVGNLECVVATGGQRIEKNYTFRASPDVVPFLKKYFTAVSLANNHTGDFGQGALVEMFDRLQKGGVPYFGAGRNLKEAHAPLIIEKNGLRVALLGYNEFRPRSFEAGPTTPGVAWSVDEQVVADIKAARSEHKADLVLVFHHWGKEYKPQPDERQRSLARLEIDAGADVVIGGHPHVTEGAEYYKGHLIVYSLGNFVFDDFKDVRAELNEPSRTSWVLRLTMSKNGLMDWDTLVSRTDDDGIPRPVKGASSPRGKAGSDRIEVSKND